MLQTDMIAYFFIHVRQDEDELHLAIWRAPLLAKCKMKTFALHKTKCAAVRKLFKKNVEFVVLCFCIGAHR